MYYFNQNLQKPGRKVDGGTLKKYLNMSKHFFFYYLNQNLQKPGAWWHPEKIPHQVETLLLLFQPKFTKTWGVGGHGNTLKKYLTNRNTFILLFQPKFTKTRGVGGHDGILKKYLTRSEHFLLFQQKFTKTWGVGGHGDTLKNTSKNRNTYHM